MSLGTAECEPFSEEFLAEIALEELKGLGWIEKETAAVRKLVEQTVSLFLSDQVLISATTPIERLERSCDVRRRRLNNQRGLLSKNLESVGIEKSGVESLPNTLYPLVYLKMLDAADFDVYSVIKDSFLEFAAGDSKKNKIKFIRIIERHLMATKMFKEVAENLLESLKGLMTPYNGRTRLGVLLFNEDPETLDRWRAIFPREAKMAEIPGETEAVKETLMENFLKVRYFAGNPHIAPGVFVQFKKMIESYVGPQEQARLSVQNLGEAFSVSLGGQTKVDRDRFQAFFAAVKTAWSKKFIKGESLVIEANLIIDGDSARGGMAI